MGVIQKKEMNLDVKNSNISIPVTSLKQSAHIYLSLLTNAINHSLHENICQDDLKQSELISLYKKQDSFKKESYRSISLLPHVSKVIKGILYV